MELFSTDKITRCYLCGRVLKSKTSIINGYGKECLNKMYPRIKTKSAGHSQLDLRLFEIEGEVVEKN